MNIVLESLHIFVVNLKKDIEKKEHMLEICTKYSLKCNFVEAVYGKDLSEEEINQSYQKEKSLKHLRREMSRGEIGCLLSHKLIYQSMMEQNIETALILEDDIEFTENIIDILSHKDAFPKDWEVVLLGHHSHAGRDIDTKSSIWWKENYIKNYSIFRPSEIGKGTYGYFINKQGAIKLFNRLSKYYKPIDHYTGNDKEVNIYAIEPAPIRIHEEMSEVHHSMNDRRKNQNKLVQHNKSQKMSPKQILRMLGLFDFVVQVRDNLKRLRPLKKYI